MTRPDLRRVLVIGSGGAGKTTFARDAERTGLPLFHLDGLYWRPGWVEPEKADWLRTVTELIGRDAWIMDGNYGGTIEPRIAAADTVIFLDLPRALCVRRVVRRRLTPGPRVGMPRGCSERLTWSFLAWIWTYPERRRPAIRERLERLRADQRAVVLRRPAEVRRFLDAVGRAA